MQLEYLLYYNKPEDGIAFHYGVWKQHEMQDNRLLNQPGVQ